MLFPTIRSRLIVIGVLTGLSVIALVPRNVTERVRDVTTGQMKDTTVRRVPVQLGLDLQGGIHLALEVDQSKGPVVDPGDAIRRAETIQRRRMDALYGDAALVQVVGNGRLIIDIPGERDPARAKSVVLQEGSLEFRITDMKNQFRDALPEIDRALRAAGVKTAGQPAAAANVAQLFGRDTTKAKGKGKRAPAASPDTSGLTTPGPLSALLFQGQLPGEFLVPEEQVPVAESLVARPELQRLKPRGIDLKWGVAPSSRAARSYRPLYAVEDRPIIKSQIAQHGQIELGSKPFQEAQDLALVLRAGALPAPLTIVEERTVGPSLGKDSIHDGIRACAIGVLLVVVIMVGYYRLSGVLAVAALGLYVLFTFAGLATLGGAGVTLTLPGLAGFALAVGIAVDANVLIFERIREELQHGKTLRTAVTEGFTHAMSAIVDSNVSTVLTALILNLIGTGPVKGFAITLIIGIAASMISAVFVVRTFFMIWLQRRPDMVTLSI